MKARVTICAVAMLCWSLAAFGGGFEQKDVSAKAKWIMHMDLEKLRSSQTHAKLLSDEQQGDFAKIAKKMNDTFGIDPRTDLTGLTMYGVLVQGKDAESKQQHRTVAIADGKFDIGRFMGAVKERKGYATEKHGKHTLMEFKIGKSRVKTSAGPVKVQGKTKTSWCCFQDKGTLVISDNKHVLTDALDTMDGTAKSLAKDAFKHLAVMAESPMFMAVANLGEISDLQPKAKFFQGAEAISIFVCEKVINAASAPASDNARLVVTAIVDGKDEVASEQTKKLLDGLLAIASLSQEKDMAPVRSLIQKVTVKRDKATLTVTFAATIAELAKQSDFLKKLKPTVRVKQ